MMNKIKTLLDKVKEAFTCKFKIHSEFIYRGITISIQKRSKTTKIVLRDTAGRHICPTSISSVLDVISITPMKYFHVRSYDKYGISVFLSDEIKCLFYRDDNRGFQEVTIPVEGNRDMIRVLLQNVIDGRFYYDKCMMNDLEADLCGNSLVLSSKTDCLNIKLYKMASALPEEETDDAYVLTQIESCGWYYMQPLSRVDIHNWQPHNIIITKEQLEENILPPINFFSCDPLIA